MARDSRAFLWDIRTAADAIAEFSRDRTFDGYLSDLMLRSAVERQFEIIGEALGQLARLDPGLAGRVPDLPQVVAFRNLLIHGYASVDHRTVWRAIEEDLPRLRELVARLLAELGESP
jgi:uncharacterized protein with HEPN domain